MSNIITRGQIGQALECAYIEKSELEDVVENILSLLGAAWEDGKQTVCDFSYESARNKETRFPDNPYKQ